MIVVMNKGASEDHIEQVIEKLIGLDFSVHRSTGAVHTVLGAVGPAELVDPAEFKVMDGVMECHRIMTPYQVSARAFRPEGTTVRFENARAGSAEIGGRAVALMAGPGSLEGEAQLMRCAELVARSGARFFRAGGLRPHMTPQQIQEISGESLSILRKAADTYGLFLALEVPDSPRLAEFEQQADLLIVASRNMRNYALLEALGRCTKPVLLRRAMAATVEELLVSADCILAGGNANVILCERGIRTFETTTRHTLDLTAIPVVHKLSHLPIVVDPSHATGRRDYVAAMAGAAVAAGADGLMMDVHPDPDRAIAEGAQSLSAARFADLAAQLATIAAAVGRSLASR